MNPDPIRVAHFFAGGGGGILAAEILGHKSILAVDNNENRCAVLREWKAEGWFPELEIICCDIRGFDPAPWKERVDCVAAGFPCQDISSAGPGGGILGPRSGLIFHAFKAVDVIRPSIIFLENSPAIRTRGRDIIIRELVARGYAWKDGTLAASHVGAGHKRDRWWCLAANVDGLRKLEQERCVAYEWGWIGDSTEKAPDSSEFRWGKGGSERIQLRKKSKTTECFGTTPDSHGVRRERRAWDGKELQGWDEFEDRLADLAQGGELSGRGAEAIRTAAEYTGCFGRLPIDSGVRRVVDGVADRFHLSRKERIAMLGDGQVPLQAAVAWVLLAWT